MVKKHDRILTTIIVSFTILICAFTALQFLTPLFIEERSVIITKDCNGNNYYIYKGDTTGIYLVFYDIGKLICHQKSQRSLKINGNQMPICVRCLGILLGVNCALILSAFVCTNVKSSSYCGNCFTNSFNRIIKLKKWEKFSLVFLSLLFTLPMVIDGLAQIFTSYESSTIMRLTTGFFFGIIEGLLVVGLIIVIYAFWKK